jgi:hypothetical protein
MSNKKPKEVDGVPKKFYYFPLKRGAPVILYEKGAEKSRLFKMLCQKMSNYSWKWRLITHPVVQYVSRLFFSKTEVVPSADIDLIYHGFDNVLAFSKHRDFVFRQEAPNEFVRSEFMGYPVDMFNATEVDSVKIVYSLLLSDHLAALFRGDRDLHGDFTVYNIVSHDYEKSYFLIDEQPTPFASKLYDFYYFFLHTTHKIERCGLLSAKERAALLFEWHYMLCVCFAVVENKDRLLAELKVLKDELDVISFFKVAALEQKNSFRMFYNLITKSQALSDMVSENEGVDQS